MYKDRDKSNIIGIIITIIVLISIVVISNMNVSNVSRIEEMATMVTMPLQNGFIYLKNKLQGNEQFFVDVRNLKEENKKLEEKNSKLEQKLRELEIIKAENDTLKEYVNLKEKYKNYQTIPAYVIEKDITNYNNFIILNIGENDGIKKNMTVIADKGLVGHVVSTTESTSKVKTIIDTSSSVSAVMGTSRQPIIVSGTLKNNYSLRTKYIPQDVQIVEEDRIETSGIGGIYPKGIPIGEIKEIIDTKNVIDRYAYVKPLVDFKKLETVLVIIN